MCSSDLKSVTGEIPKKKWIKPSALGNTPMSLGFTKSLEIIQNWIQSHNDSHPPILINITDGIYTDQDPSSLVGEIRSQKTSNGSVLVFNIHIHENDHNGPIVFPDDSFIPPIDSDGNPIEVASKLFNMSSKLTHTMVVTGLSMKKNLTPDSRGFAYNANFTDLIDFLQIGTRLEIENKL